MAWIDRELATDADLTNYERRMPDQAKSFKGANGSNSFDGKRDLAKRDIATRLVRMGLVPDDLTDSDVVVLNKTAVFHELALIFHDLSDTKDSIAQVKAVRYDSLYEDSWIDVAVSLTVPAQYAGVSNIPLHRS
jgi:hypothetical protein